MRTPQRGGSPARREDAVGQVLDGEMGLGGRRRRRTRAGSQVGSMVSIHGVGMVVNVSRPRRSQIVAGLVEGAAAEAGQRRPRAAAASSSAPMRRSRQAKAPRRRDRRPRGSVSSSDRQQRLGRQPGTWASNAAPNTLRNPCMGTAPVVVHAAHGMVQAGGELQRHARVAARGQRPRATRSGDGTRSAVTPPQRSLSASAPRRRRTPGAHDQRPSRTSVIAPGRQLDEDLA